MISVNWHRSAAEIKQAVIDDVRQHIGSQKVFDDITLLVLKRENNPSVYLEPHLTTDLYDKVGFENVQ
jgi:hypothetical protein